MRKVDFSTFLINVCLKIIFFSFSYSFWASVYGSQAIVHWIFVKEATSPEEAVKGIMTKDDYNKQKK